MERKQSYQFDTEGEAIPTQAPQGRVNNGKPVIGTMASDIPDAGGDSSTKPQSETVGADSAPGWVRKNIGTFEKTERFAGG